MFLAGQITGVEGYVESVAMGWLAGRNATRLLDGEELLIAPRATAIGALAHYVSGAETKNYQPVNITFALLAPLSPEQARSVRRKRDRHLLQVKLALAEWNQWLQIIAEPELAAH
jgi:methylenetetrahydrofolate--tRNA-(uracil-5-)-methyltransferase